MHNYFCLSAIFFRRVKKRTLSVSFNDWTSTWKVEERKKEKENHHDIDNNEFLFLAVTYVWCVVFCMHFYIKDVDPFISHARLFNPLSNQVQFLNSKTWAVYWKKSRFLKNENCDYAWIKLSEKTICDF